MIMNNFKKHYIISFALVSLLISTDAVYPSDTLRVPVGLSERRAKALLPASPVEAIMRQEALDILARDILSHTGLVMEISEQGERINLDWLGIKQLNSKSYLDISYYNYQYISELCKSVARDCLSIQRIAMAFEIFCLNCNVGQRHACPPTCFLFFQFFD